MSTSHATVAAKFGRGQPAKGSRMESIACSRKISPHFTIVADGVSYHTTIAQVVVNHHTGLSELWVTPSTYSQTTNRHERHFIGGFIDAYRKNHGCDYETAHNQVFYTRAVPDGGHRCNPEHARLILQTVQANLHEVDKPRLRTATRRGTLTSCLTRTQEALRRMTQDVPVDYPDAETLYELQDMEAFIANTLAIDDIDEARAAVRAWLTLNDPKNQ